MNTTGERIVSRMAELGLKQKDLVDMTGASKGTVSLWIQGTNNPTNERLVKLAKALHTTPDWLITGQGEADRNVEGVTNRMLPVLTWVQAGNFTTVEAISNDDIKQWLPSLSSGDCPECFFLRVRGISNYPTFHEDDLIQVNPSVQFDELNSGDLIVVRHNDEATFKKLVIEPNGHKYLQALNEKWQPNIMEFAEDMTFVGQVIDAVRPIQIPKTKRQRS